MFMDYKKEAKSLFKPLTIIQIVGLTLVAIGSILMFFDQKPKETPSWEYDYSIGDWIYSPIYRDESLPISGLLPSIGLFVIIISLILIYFSKKKNKKFLIGVCVLNLASLILLFSPVFEWVYNIIATVGYAFCCTAACLLFCNIGISLAILLYNDLAKNNKAIVQNQNVQQTFASSSSHYGDFEGMFEFNRCADLLKVLYGLYLSKAILEDEYIHERDKILDYYHIIPYSENSEIDVDNKTSLNMVTNDIINLNPINVLDKSMEAVETDNQNMDEQMVEENVFLTDEINMESLVLNMDDISIE